jgi:TRAP-type mannitol/chloroaromatic compound transport system permease small subunit
MQNRAKRQISLNLGRRLIAASSHIASYVFLPALILVSVFDIIGRQFFDTGSTLLQELQWHFFFAIVMLGLGYTYWQDRHVRIDLVSSRLSVRQRAWIELLGYVLLVLPFSWLLIRFGTEFAWDAWQAGERAQAAMGLAHRWIIKTTVPISGVLILVAGTLLAWRNVQRLRGRSAEVDD